MSDPEAAKAKAATTFPIRLGFPLGDGNWDKRYVTLLLHESGEVAWDAEGFKERETTELDAVFGSTSAGGSTP